MPKSTSKKKYKDVRIKDLHTSTSGDSLRPGAISTCFPYVPMEFIKYCSGHSQDEQAETIWKYAKPPRIILNNCAICLAGFIPAEYGKISKCNVSGSLKHLCDGLELEANEIISMCDLQFNITTFTHHCFHIDGDL